jgi:hypothetical protein
MKKVSVVTLVMLMMFSTTYAAGSIKPGISNLKNEINKVKLENVQALNKVPADC